MTKLVGSAVLAVIAIAAPGVAWAQPVQSRSTHLWTSLSACWATVSPTVSLLIDEIGPATLLANSQDEVAYEVRDMVSGKVVFRARCKRVENGSLFRRYIEFP